VTKSICSYGSRVTKPIIANYYCGSSIERPPLLLKRLIDRAYLTSSKAYTRFSYSDHWDRLGPTDSHKHLRQPANQRVLSFRSSVRLYAWPVAECCAVISPSHRRCCRDLQTALVLHEVMGWNRFSMLSSGTKRYYTPVSCRRAGFMCIILRLIVYW